MNAALRIGDERKRLDALRQYALLDTPPEQDLDDLTALAAHICEAPISLISLVDEGRQWFKSKLGWSIEETPRNLSFCAHALHSPEPFIVPDAALDDRFADNPLVTGDPGIRFYAGAPLLTPDGHILGTLCVIDRVPRQLSESQTEALRILGRQVMAQLWLRRQARELAEREGRLRAIFQAEPECVKLLAGDGSLLEMNPAGLEMIEADSFQQVENRCVYPLIVEEHRQAFRELTEAVFSGTPGTLEFEVVGLKGGRRWLETHATPLRDASGHVTALLGITRDVTERKRADAALAESQRWLQAIIDHFPGLVSAKDLTGTVILVNRNFSVLEVQSPGELVGKNIYDLFPRAIADALWKNDLAVQEADRPLESEETVVHKDGTTHTYLTVKFPVHDASESLAATCAISVDISQRKETEEALRLSTERFNLVTRATNDAVWDWDLLNNTIWWNEGFQTLFGYAREDIEPGVASWTNHLHRDDADRVTAGIFDVINGTGTSWSAEYRFQRKDGTYAEIFDRGYVIRDLDGKAVRMVGAMIDLTARKQAEERFRQLAEHIQQVFWMIDAATGEILYVSPAYEAMWGRTCASLYESRSSWLNAIHPEDRKRLEPLMDTREPSGEYDETYRIVRPDGTIRWIRDRAFPIRDPRGRLIRIVGTATDITERRELEDQFRQAQKMEIVGRLAGGIAHDFNNLLTVINGMTDLAISSLGESHPLRGDLGQIRLAGDRAAALTRQLLALSRQQILAPEVLDLNGVVRDMQGMLRRVIGEDVDIVFALSEKLGYVKADPGQIEQVILNLAVNARDAMPDGGTLTIATADVDSSADSQSRTSGPQVMLSVSDTGVGMDEPTRQKAFDPFFTTKDVGKGTGLGLSTVYGIVKQSGGTITISSETGGGTTFRICLPRVTAVPRTLQPAQAAAAGEGTETILVVEDEPGLRHLTRRFLDAAGYTVLEAANGKAALEVLGNYAGAVDVMITDVVMPGMNGRELAARLASIRPQTKVLYMSGYTDDAIFRLGVLDDATRFLSKPFTSADLRRKVRDVIDS
jgi:two-component system, cell cycle sensor histidine kinase and response regulator CckA